MNTPILTRLCHAHPAQLAQLPALQRGPGVHHFVVTRGGKCSQGHWSAGEVLVCLGGAAEGDRVVLVPRGRGAPCIGQIQNNKILGDAGEPCHPGRWQVAGRLVGTWQQLGEGWVCALTDVERANIAPARLAPARPVPSGCPTPVLMAAPLVPRSMVCRPQHRVASVAQRRGMQLALFAA